MNIYRRLYKPGKVIIRFNKEGANLRGIPMTMFFGPDTSGTSPVSCGGKELLISKPGNPFYIKCKQNIVT
jgi:hypothetical protein